MGGSPFHIAYGFDKVEGVFLSVYDDRLGYDPNASDEINNVFAESPRYGLESGEGCYLDLYTGDIGIGIKTSWPVMCEYLKRYGVPGDRILELQQQHLNHGNNSAK